MGLSEDQTEFLSRTFHGLDLRGGTCHGRTFDDCRFQECNFSEMRFEDCRFTGCVLEGCNLSVCRVDRSRFSDFRGCLFIRTDLSGADFTDAIDYDIDVNLNVIRGARFSRQEAVRLLEHLGIELVD
jgi:fluoroquinolone resistance protein